MTDAELTEAFALVRHHSSPLVHPLLDSLERMYAIDRAFIELQRVKVHMADGIVGHRVYDDNHQHSRRAQDPKGQS